MTRPSTVLIAGLAVAALAVGFAGDTAMAAQSPFGVLTPDGGGSFGGPLAPVFAWVRQWQVELNDMLRGEMTTLEGNGAAVWLLLGLSFLYGIFHAAGPGHGKAVITSFLLASGDSARRGVLLSFAAAFVQALTAIIVVGVANMIFHVTAKTMTSATDWLEIGSYALIALVGAWLLWSKMFGGGHHHHHHHHVAMASGPHVEQPGHSDEHAHVHAHVQAHVHDHHHHHGRHLHDHGERHVAGPAHRHDDHDHGHDHDHQDGHHHDHDHGHEHHHHNDHDHGNPVATAAHSVPVGSRSLAAVEPRNILVRAWSAILAVGIRPCSGAILILVFAVGQGMVWTGVAATFAMAVGTGLTVAILAALAVSAKDFAVRFAGPESESASWIVRTVEVAGAAAVMLFGLLLLGGALSGAGPT